MADKNCPCNSGKSFSGCCGPFLQKPGSAPDPESLMRSRYTAFCRKDAGYLIQTFAPGIRTGKEEWIRQELGRMMARTTWVGLTVFKSRLEGTDKGFVEFSAFFKQDGTDGSLGQLHEHSTFIKEKGTWFYVDGEILAPVTISRNQPCVCGSGVKFKRCHGK